MTSVWRKMKNLFIATLIILSACQQNSANKTAASAQSSMANFEGIEKLDPLLLEEAELSSNTNSSISTRSNALRLQSSSRLDTTIVVDSNCHSQLVQNLTSIKKQNIGIRSYNSTIDKDTLFDPDFNKQIKEDPCILSVGPKLVMKKRITLQDAELYKQDHIQQIKLPEALLRVSDKENKNENTVIAIIDDGVDFDHQDLFDNTWYNRGETGVDKNGIPKYKNGIDDDRNGYIDDFIGYNFVDQNNNALPYANSNHGTHVAGLAAARSNLIGVSGVHGRAKIMSINVFGNSLYTSNALIENAIRYAADNGADVINLSLGVKKYSRSVEAAIAYANKSNVVVVVAAGNEREKLSKNRFSKYYESPGSLAAFYDGVITVTAIDSSTERFSTYSNFGTDVVEIAAPGSETSSNLTFGIGLLSTIPNNQYARYSGTSMSAPLVAGAASLAISLLKSKGIRPKNSHIKKLLIQSATYNSSLLSRVKGSKALNVQALIKSIKN